LRVERKFNRTRAWPGRISSTKAFALVWPVADVFARAFQMLVSFFDGLSADKAGVLVRALDDVAQILKNANHRVERDGLGRIKLLRLERLDLK